MKIVVVLCVVAVILLACAPTLDGEKVSTFKTASQCVRVTDGYPMIHRCVDRAAGVVVWRVDGGGAVVLPIEETNLR